MHKWSDYFSAPPSRVTVIGMAKNAGKTVTQNYLRTLAHTDGRVIGLLSVGLDGEKTDAMTNLPKPVVWVEPGTIVATAEALIERPLLWECLKKTGISTTCRQDSYPSVSLQRAACIGGTEQKQ